MNYYWVRIYDYSYSDELAFKENNEYSFETFKGQLLDEYYLCGEGLSRDGAKAQVIARSHVTRFAKPRKKNDSYAIVKDSEKFFYDRFYKTVDSVCLFCNKPVKGKWAYIPRLEINGSEYYFCDWQCRHSYEIAVDPDAEGEWQSREDYTSNGGVYGYIYHIYNRRTDMHYIGQTRYMPFFRWQEHVKDAIKGDICDLTFEVINECRVLDKGYLNDLESWWINKFNRDYGAEHVMNIQKPQLTTEHFINLYDEIMRKRTLLERLSNPSDAKV